MSETPSNGETPIVRPRRSPAAIRAAADDFRTADAQLRAAGGDADPKAAKRNELLVSALFALGGLFGVGFLVAYFAIKLGPKHGDVLDQALKSNLALGLTLTGALLCLGAGVVLWVKLLMPHPQVTEDRHDFFSTEEDRLAAAADFNRGAEEAGVGRRPLLVGSLLAGTVPLLVAPIALLRDAGPMPGKTLRHTAWFKGSKLIDLTTGEPVKLGMLAVGSLVTVMPEGATVEEDATSPTILIRLRPEEYKPVKGKENWAPEGHVAYNKICTHAGCPIGLYEQQTHQLFCPCHQSTFNVLEHCKVVFGPAARPLPQLEIYLDDEGYFRAAGDFNQPVGPSFWERG
ncbi:MAG: ubiquinol-cytochrome c reductase iron-sulfur subunit [Frankiaceae bacterium]|jgi:ubiquinol-cytochrome c reductase iron-sulfur subunit|nr:ubiquinol-cytochrome c reductase iron-sulfur subunit [Frankiaceae bacterium]MDX6225926.1 ubiquinol-cytochrome c reductase iron-sulfur subunit [Frankiales bacterium]MDX6272846.1 ubiquinol-cytochrome c reductase iron-sulfur subunit [Frankiales bacterium]